MITKLFRNGEDLYIIVREFSINYLTDKSGNTNNELFNLWKEHLNSDKVFKNQTHFLFCQTITEPEWESVNKDILESQT
jgi:hypothetical protein